MYVRMGCCSYIRMTVLLLHLRYWWRLTQHATAGVPWLLTYPFRSVQLPPRQLLPLIAAGLKTDRPHLQVRWCRNQTRVGQQAKEPINIINLQLDGADSAVIKRSTPISNALTSNVTDMPQWSGIRNIGGETILALVARPCFFWPQHWASTERGDTRPY